ncbi:cupin domain-containing protein [Mesorhizobium sp. GbtcB19]|uniref:cupin domain-containing protein n=1 Tax=Mesorhizobium sp. GbtcB19 TaxID=2824764 RepID=UPI001C2F5492|nr:cupin domain-containing protein [Mesorhizobium sp. GbtcB19]
MTTQELTNRVERGSRFIDLNSAVWIEAEPGVQMKTIYKDEASGESTILMKLDPGSRSAMHAHDQLEEVLVLEGSFSDQDHTYTAGQYCIRAIGAEHETFSETGGIVLLIYRR